MENLFTIDFLQITTYVMLIAICAVSVVVAALSYKLLNAVPAKWLCDYDEEPSAELLKTRYNFKQSGIYTSALFAILNMLAFAVYGFSGYTLFVAAITFVLFLIALCDGKFTIIPDQFTVALAVLCVGFAVFDLVNNKHFIDSWWSILAGATCGGAFLLLVNLLSIVLFKKSGMGFGDVKLMAALGACLGFPKVFITLLLAVVVAFLFIIVLVIKNAVTKKDASHYFPFGPFLCIASVGTFLFIGSINQLINWYISLLTF